MQEELEKLTKKFKERELESLSIVNIPDGKYLIIRLDGFKASRNLLKDVPVNKKFNSAFNSATTTVYLSLRNYLTKQYPSSIMNVTLFNDEISFVLNKDNEHRDAKRIMKLCSLFSGMLSGAFTNKFVVDSSSNDVVAFDARPVIVSQKEIAQYIRYRTLVATRYAYWKVLRLNEIDGCYEDEIKNNIENSISECKEHQLVKEANKILQTYQIFFPEKTRKPRLVANKISNININESKLTEKIAQYEEFQNKNKNKVKQKSRS